VTSEAAAWFAFTVTEAWTGNIQQWLNHGGVVCRVKGHGTLLLRTIMS
jgi:hypothetical protein